MALVRMAPFFMTLKTWKMIPPLVALMVAIAVAALTGGHLP